MKKSTKIWLWFALILCVCTTILNATQSRWLAVGIAVVSIGGLCVLLFKEKKVGFYVMCICACASFIVGSVNGIRGDTGILLSVGMSLIGASIVPLITFLFVRSQWKEMN